MLPPLARQFPGSVGTYCVLVYVASFGASTAIALTGGTQGPLAVLMLLGMLAPTVAAVVARLVHGEGFDDVRWRRFSLKHALLGLILTPVTSWLIVALYHGVAGYGLELASWLTPTVDGLIRPPADTGLGEPFPAAELPGRLRQKLIYNLPLMCVFTFGEEFGWRSFLQTRLAQRLPASKAILLTALVWGYWHTGYFYLDSGSLEPVERVLAVLVLAPLNLVGVGIWFGWLFQRSGSLWVVVLAHAALNKWSALPLRYLADPTAGNARVYALSIGWAILGLAGYMLLSRTERVRST